MLSTRLAFAVCSLAAGVACAWAVGCSSDNPTPGPDSGPSSSSSSGSGSSGSGSSSGSSSGGPSDGGIVDAKKEASLGLLIDDMTKNIEAGVGSQIQLEVPDGDTPGSYYTYADMLSNTNVMMTRVNTNIFDMSVTPPVTNADGTKINAEICFNGSVVSYAGLGLTLAYGPAPLDATVSPPIPFDASKYSGVSFYIYVDPDAGPAPAIRLGIPDTQTADPAAWPTAACSKAEGGVCDDDFGGNVIATPGVWTPVSFTWDQLNLVGFGMPLFNNIMQNGLIGMKWQVNGPGVEASIEPFKFCISNIYFTP